MESILTRIDGDILGVCMILATIGGFALMITTVAMVADIVKSIAMAKMSKQMIEDLMNKGYSASEIERLVYGEPKWNRVRRMFSRLRSKAAPTVGNRPMPPVKQHAV